MPQRDDFERMESKLDKVLELLHGADGNNGLMTRVRLLEETENSRKAVGGWVLGIVAGLIGSIGTILAERLWP